MIRTITTTVALAALLAIGPMTSGRQPLASPAEGEAAPAKLPDPPANGEMGFVVSYFIQPVIQGPDACPQGTSPKLRDAYLAKQTPEERARLMLKENENELSRSWQADTFGPGGTNICSQPDMFPNRSELRLVQSRFSWGLDLDGDSNTRESKGRASKADTCEHDSFQTPTGEQGIDNQEYRVMGCTLEWRGVDGVAGDQEIGMRQFHASGEWTQVILLRGVNSLVRDDHVDVIYANTPDRPTADSTGKFLPGSSFSVSDRAPRNRNVLNGRIDNGVLTTDPQDILLTQTWGQGGARDIRGNRTKYDFRKGRMRLTFQPDGSLTGILGGYRPVFDVIQSPALGGAGSAVVAGIDCAAELNTLRKYADGIRDPKTGKCSGVSSAIRIAAIPAFVNDVPSARTAAR
ncbi:MAG: hypothetical protein ABIM50_00750 [Novosphingobium sp.]